MNPTTLEALSLKTHGNTYQLEMITDIIPKGKTLLYGDSGVGKTHSIIKHLNRHKKKPVLLDFDFNKKVDDLDAYFVDGVFYLNAIRGNGNVELIKERRLLNIEKREYLEPRIKEAQSRMADLYTYKSHTYEQVDKAFIADSYFANKYGDDEKVIDYMYHFEDELKHRMELKGLNYDMNLKDQIIIIDTSVRAVSHFADFARFEAFINRLLRDGNDVILISHSHINGNKKVPDIDEIFANHVDCRLRLNKDILKTKATDVYLVVEKLRGYKGADIIKGWER